MVNYKEIITKEEIDNMSQEKYDFAVKEGLYHAKYLRAQYGYTALQDMLASRAIELATIGTKYYQESKEVQLVLASNIVFPDNQKIIEILLSKNITYDKLCVYARLISGLNRLASQASTDVDDEVKISNKKVNNLCALFRMYFGISDYNIIVTKLNEIVSRHRELYLSLEGQKVR